MAIKWRRFPGQILNQTLCQTKIPSTEPASLKICAIIFELKGYSADWEHIDNCEDERLVTTLSMICPFDVPEKQALLECPDLQERAKLLIAILEMASHADEDENTVKH